MSKTKSLEESLNWLTRFSKNVAIVSTMHEPSQSLMPSIKRITPMLKDIGLSWNISMTEATRKRGSNAEEFYNHLNNNFKVNVDREKFPNIVPEDMIEANHVSALSLALSSGKPYVLYIDSDRLSMALNYYPDETQRVFNKAFERELMSEGVTILSRSPKAINTHLSSLVLTEQIIHHFYNKHLNVGQDFIDVASTGYLMASKDIEKMLRQNEYNGGEYLGAKCTFPHPKFIMSIINSNEKGVYSIPTEEMLRYEAPEQMRNDDRLKIINHSWTPECYEKITLSSRGVQEDIMSEKIEWVNRFSTVHQYLDVLNKLWLEPRNIKDEEMQRALKDVEDIMLIGQEERYFRNNSVDLFYRYSY